MKETLNVVNELLVDIFNDILTIEQKALNAGKLSDLSLTEVHTIEAIGMEPNRTMSEVAQQLRITVGTLTVAINNLARKGYVERKRTEEDRRIVFIELTRKGKLVFRVHNKFHADMVRATVDGLSKEEEEILTESLNKLNTFFKERYGLMEISKKELQK